MKQRHKKITKSIFLALILIFLSGTSIYAQYSMSGSIGASVGQTKSYSVVGSNIFQTSWSVGSQGSIQTSTNPGTTTIQVQWNSNGNSYVRVDLVDSFYNSHFVQKSVSVSQPPPPAPGNPTASSIGCGRATLTRSGSPPSGTTWYWQGKVSNGFTTTKGSGSTFTATEGTGTYYIRAYKGGSWSTSLGSRYVSIVNLTSGSINGVQTICYNGNPSTLGNSSSAGGISGSYSYQWQYSSNGSSGWTSISGATSSTYNPPGGLTSSRWYRRRVSCSAQIKYTGSVKVTVASTPGTPSSPTITNNCGNTVLTRGTPPSGITWYWQSSSSGTSTSNSNSSVTRTSGTAYYLRGRNSSGCWGTSRTISYTVTQPTTWYSDTDGDGFGNSSATNSSCGQPSGYVSNSSDHDDTTIMITNLTPQTYYSDVDGDGFGVSSPTVYASFKPLGYATNTSDQCPTEPGTNNGCANVSVQLSDENYVHNRVFQDDTGTESIESVTYYDGLGRPKQQVAIKGSGNAGALSPNSPSEWVMDWTLGSGGTAFFNRNGDVSENARVLAPDPFGNSSLVWECGNKPDSGPDGGWNTDYINVDKTKTYRYTVWVRRDQSNSGHTYHGTWNVDNLGGGANGNPYFWVGDPPQLGEWYLLVGIIHPYNHGSTDTGISGVYDKQGNRVIDATEFKWRSDTTTSRFRSYLYYSTDVNQRQYFYQPILEIVDGNEIPLQDMFNNGEPKDLVSHIGYDDYGRQDKEWLPYYESAGNLGSYRGDVATTTQQYYQNQYPEDFIGLSTGNVNAYSQREFEDSPLSRVLEQGAPGKDWKLNGGHGIQFDYLTNGTNEVRQYRVSLSFANNTYTPSLSADGHYPVNELYKTVTKDENWSSSTDHHTTEEFKDREGKIVLKRTYNNGAHDTYYVYDDYGNLSYVLPPKVVHDSNISTMELSELCYQYVYDQRNRLVEKKIPGKGWEEIVYDKLDRPIMTRDENLKILNQWLFTKYDAFGRVIFTGRDDNTSSTRTALQNAADNTLATYEEKRGTALNLAGTNVYYSNDAYPTSYNQVFTINYYDDYVFDRPGLSLPATVLTQNTTLEVKGLPTGTKVRILGTTDWTTTMLGYDDRKRPIWTKSINDYLNTTDLVETRLDFPGKPLEVKTTHTKGANPAIVTTDVFEYDHMGRLVKQQQTLGGNTETLVQNNYDQLGQLVFKETGGGLQTVDYSYNVRGWLKQINNSANLGNDLFAFDINYNSADHGGPALYNGNIAETEWKTANDNSLRWYRYGYDALNRITSAVDNSTNYNIYDLTYDKNGNILTLKRKGNTNVGATTFGTMDNLEYTYKSVGNQLKRVKDYTTIDQGYNDGVDTTEEYTYDANGNMITDGNKGITAIGYNHLNLPTSISINGNGANGTIAYIYDAMGIKLKKTVGSDITEYAGNYIYGGNSSSSLQFFNHPEGYVTPDGQGGYEYVYQYKDHLGNVRLSYTDNNGTLEIIEENNYYPFGLEHKGYNNVVNGTEHPYKYNGKEHEQELGLNSYDFGARSYMPDLGRWKSLDPHADSYFSVTPYSSFANNPISFTDPTGKDILFWRFNSDGDGGGDWEQVGYDQLDEKSQKAISNFAQTKSGKEFLGSFANKGDKIGDVEFSEDGKYANHNFNFGEYSSYGSAEGTTPFPRAHTLEGPAQEGSKGPSYIDFYSNLNTFIENSTDINFAETVGHEVFLHLKQYLDAYVEAFENNGRKGADAVINENKKGNYKGYRDHFSMGNKTKASKEYYDYINQLKSVFNPRGVQKHVDAERKKNLNAAKAQKRASGDK